jgi:predicted O-linked N-acetylglucosamine transferase (SPINDLY family)
VNAGSVTREPVSSVDKALVDIQCFTEKFEDMSLNMNAEIRKVLQQNPEDFNTCYQVANYLLAQGNPQTAVSFYQKALELNPSHVDAHNNLGRALNECHEIERAIGCFQTAVDLEPEFAEGYFNLGLALKKQGKFEAAIAQFQQSLKLNPQLAIAQHVLGEVLHEQGKYDEAIIRYHKALRIQPDFAEAHYNLGHIAKERGHLTEAIHHLQKAIDVKPNFAEAYNNLGLIFSDQDQPNQAVHCYQKALQIEPGLVEAYYNLGIVHQTRGDYQAGLSFYEQALQINPDYAPAKWLYYFSLPILYDSEADIGAYRRRFADNLDTLIGETKLATPEGRLQALKGVASTTHFYLAYQGQNDLALQKKYGRFVCRVMAANYPAWSTPITASGSATEGKTRLGYVSSFMRNHTVGVYLQGWLENHDRSEFEIFCYHIGHQTDALTNMFQQHSDHFYQLGGNIELAAEHIIADDLDVLVFTDIGMNAPATQLAALRLAPVQCKGWGHPVTTGLPTIDYYLSSDLMEPENACDHYSEKLIRLPNLALAYKKPILPATPKSRKAFGIRADAFVYLISQSLFKLLPQFDTVYASIAHRVPNAQFVFISHENAAVTAKFKHRLAKAFQLFDRKLENFCLFMPRQNHPDFLSLNLACDVLLDTFCWSGGNTTLEAISCNLPVVTCPGEFMRGRHAYAMLEMMGIRDTIAESEKTYIELAVQMAQDKDFYIRVKQHIVKNRSRLFENASCVRALETFYRQAAAPQKPKSDATDDGSLDVHEISAGKRDLKAKIYYERGKKRQNENDETKAIENFQKALAHIPSTLGITPEYSCYLFDELQPPAHREEFVSEIYQALAECLYRQKRLEDAWLAARAALVYNPANGGAGKLAEGLIVDIQKSQPKRIGANDRRYVPGRPAASEIANKLTIIVVTNFTEKLDKFAHLSPPGSGLVETTYGSILRVLGRRLSGCKKILCYDRKHQNAKHENQYQVRLTKFAHNHNFDLHVVVQHGLQKVLRKFLENVSTPYLLFLEHDWEFQGPEINLDNLLNVFDQHPIVNYVRFNKRQNIISNFDIILEKEMSIKDVDLIRTAAHSNNPHLVRVQKLRNDWLPICLSDPLCQKMDLSDKAFGIENPLFKRHMRDVRKMGFTRAHQIWGTYIYGQIGDPPRIKHLGE